VSRSEKSLLVSAICIAENVGLDRVLEGLYPVSSSNISVRIPFERAGIRSTTFEASPGHHRNCLYSTSNASMSEKACC